MLWTPLFAPASGCSVTEQVRPPSLQRLCPAPSTLEVRAPGGEGCRLECASMCGDEATVPARLQGESQSQSTHVWA